MENDDFGRPSDFQLWLEAQRFRFACVPASNVPHNYANPSDPEGKEQNRWGPTQNRSRICLSNRLSVPSNF